MALKLPRLSAGGAIVDGQGRPTAAFLSWWAQFADRIETEVGALAAAQAAQDAAAAANSAAAAANAAAGAAQGVADGLAALAALQASFVSAGTTLTGSDDGTSARASVSAHTRLYGDGSTVAVAGGSVGGLGFSANAYLYYDQASRAGGAVAYAATSDFAAAQPTATQPDRHYVGVVTLPADGGADTAGVPNIPILPPSFDAGAGW
jgi:hypothetical protein